MDIINIDLSSIITTLLGGLILWGIRRTSKSFDDVGTKFETQDEKMGKKLDKVGVKIDTIKDNQAKLFTNNGKLQTWAEGHENQDTERFKTLSDQIKDLSGRVK